MKVHKVSKSYGSHQVLKDISMDIQNGIYGFLGANGVGKTTLFKIISGYSRSFTGSLEYPKVDNDKQVLLGYLPQEFVGYPELTIKEFLLYMGKLKSNASEDIIEKEIQHKIEIFNLKRELQKKLKMLSGGQLRRVGLSQAFLLNPKIVLLDEPTTGLDPTERIKFKNFISGLSGDQTILISTHIVTDLEFISKEIFIVKDGNFVAQGDEDTLIQSAENLVWEATPQSIQEQEEWLGKYLISKIYEINGTTKMRIISPTKPSTNATLVKATLDDVYLLHFKEKGDINEDGIS